MNVLDWCLVVLAALYALSGYWQGFVTGAFATAGLLLGGLFGVWVAPIALGDAEPSLGVSLGALFIVILAASLGQAILQYAGARIRDHITWRPIRSLDALGGAALSAAAVLVVAWALGVAISGTRIGAVTPLVRESTVLARVNDVLPDQAPETLRSFNNVVGSSFFPRYLEPFAPERIVQVGPGPRRMLTDPEVGAAAASVLKVRGNTDCGSGIEGTGFLYADDRVLTNAHVVAGVTDVEVERGGTTVPADVVVYDPQFDLAVLSIDDGGLPHLSFDREAAAGDPVAVLGYPQDGPYDVQSGRIRSEQRLQSPDIYGSGRVLRDVYSVRALIRQGNSGGPMVNADGKVVGVVFAASVTDTETGYALTASQVASVATRGIDAYAGRDTGDCVG